MGYMSFMKKLLKVLRSKWFIAVLAGLLTLIFALYWVRRSNEGEAVSYDFRYYDSYGEGMPDYGLHRRNNIMPQ